jgi:hypothetical protein
VLKVTFNPGCVTNRDKRSPRGRGGAFGLEGPLVPVIKAIGNNEERKRNHSTETQVFNVENPLQQREVKTTDASQQNFTISVVCLQTMWAIL